MMILAIGIGTVCALDVVTSATVVGDGHFLSYTDTRDVDGLFYGNGNIKYDFASSLNSNDSIMGIEFLVDETGVDGKSRFKVELEPDRFGVSHVVDIKDFSKIDAVASVTSSTEYGKLIDSHTEVIAKDAHGIYDTTRYSNSKSISNEWGYISGDMINFTTDVFEQCQEFPGAVYDPWLMCEFEIGDPFGDEDWNINGGQLDTCETCA